ncbi:hypothetical protein ABPG75_007664 [Micractinium tetrahymenae]
MPTLAELYVYPVKACRGVPVDSAVVTPTGLAFDRNWVIVRAESGKFLTQRQLPKLALVEVELVPGALLQGADLAAHPDAKLVLRAPGMAQELQVPITASPVAGKKIVPVTVWDWSGLGADEGDAAASWLSSYLGIPVRLVRYAGQAGTPGAPADDPQRRAVDPAWAPVGSEAETAFSDGYAFLLANAASLDDLNRHLAAKGEAALPINRFRPNFVVAGADPWQEDAWASLRFGGGDGGVAFENVKPCDRCKVTTINQATAEEGLEPLVTLRERRSGNALGWGAMPKGAVFFATNLVARQRGVVRRGDAVEVTALHSGPPAPRSPPQ